MMQFKKCALFLATVAAAGSLAGCAQNNEKSHEDPPPYGTENKTPENSYGDPAETVRWHTVQGIMEETETGYVSKLANTLAVFDGEFAFGTFSCNVTSTDKTDSGLVFGLSTNGAEYFWEYGVTYYFYFLGQGGKAYLGKVASDGWHILNTKNIGTIDPDREYSLKVIYNKNRITCFIDGEIMFGYKDTQPLSGKGYGLRTGAPDIVFSNIDITDEFVY